MADYNKKLSELYRRVAEDELGVEATIDEYGWIQCEHPNLGEFQIVLREYSPEYMQIAVPFFDDQAVPREVLLRAANTVNTEQDAVITVSDVANVVRARITLLLAPHGMIPPEALLRPVIGHALSKVVDTANAFMGELEKLAQQQV